jgi:hypothetical protein
VDNYSAVGARGKEEKKKRKRGRTKVDEDPAPACREVVLFCGG